MPVNSYRGTKISSQAKPLVDQTLAKVAKKDQAKVKQALADVATENGDKFLDKAEAQAVADVFESAAAGRGGTVSGAALDAALAQVGVAARQLSAASNVDGITTSFSVKESLESRLISELKGSVDRAAGRPLDVDMMIFEFQSDEIEKAIVDIARNNPNVTVRVIADSTQATASGGNALPSILEAGLPNIQVKFKKDFPYSWSKTDARPVYNHAATSGLNHHKGFATYIDGVPDSLVTGSFNWSDTADEKNYEDLVTFHGVDASTRRAIEQYQDEFVGYFNNDAAVLSPNNFRNFKREMWDQMCEANGVKASAYTPLPDDRYPVYEPRAAGASFDVNGFRASDRDGLRNAVGGRLAATIIRNRDAYGRFASFDELLERVPSVGKLEEGKLEALRKQMQLGSMTVSINNGSAEELHSAGMPEKLAQAVVQYRSEHGDFESIDQLAQVPGMSDQILNGIRSRLSDDDVEAFFNSRPYGATQGGTGYGAESSGRTTVAMGPDGSISAQPASVTVASNDLFNRAVPGQTIKVAMYGMSVGAPEYDALVAAARRGVEVKVVLEDTDTQSTVAALKSLQAKGLPIDVRVQKAKTMHEKFGVVGDDVFFGSANFSSSSSTKHSEDRFEVKNNEEMAAAFQERFDALWESSH